MAVQLKYPRIINSRIKHTLGCLLGDFKAHTSTSQDFICINEHVCDAFSLDEVTKQSLNRNLLEDLGISTLRYNADKSKLDIYGKRLLSLCKSLDVHIVNDRLGNDKKYWCCYMQK